MLLATRVGAGRRRRPADAGGARADRRADERSCRRSPRGSDDRAIDDAIEALAKGTEAFAAERMNRGIRQALAGRNVERV